MTKAVPVAGLFMARIHIYESECSSVLEVNKKPLKGTEKTNTKEDEECVNLTDEDEEEEWGEGWGWDEIALA